MYLLHTWGWLCESHRSQRHATRKSSISKKKASACAFGHPKKFSNGQQGTLQIFMESMLASKHNSSPQQKVFLDGPPMGKPRNAENSCPNAPQIHALVCIPVYL